MACKLTPERKEELKRLFAEDPAAFTNALREDMAPGRFVKILEAWKAGLLSSPSTWGANWFSNAAKWAMTTFVEVPTAGLIDPLVAQNRLRLMRNEMNGLDAKRGSLLKLESITEGERKTRLKALDSQISDLKTKIETRKGRERFAGELGAQLTGSMRAFPDAMKKFGAELVDIIKARNERVELEPGKADAPIGTISGRKGTYIRSPFRILDATDRFFKDIAGEAALHRLAYREGKFAKKSGRALHEHAEKLVQDYHNQLTHEPKLEDFYPKKGQPKPGTQGELWKKDFEPPKIDPKTGKLERSLSPEEVRMSQVATQEYGQALRKWRVDSDSKFKGWRDEITKTRLYETFQLPTEAANQGVLGTLAKSWQDTTRTHPIFQLLTPFIRTPTNIAYQTLERTPLGFVEFVKDVGDALQKKQRAGAQSGDVTDAYARAMAGTGIMLMFYAFAKQGILSGSGPDDTEKRRNWEAAGNQANSILVNGKWWTYDRLEPGSSLVSAAANLVEMEHEKTASGKVRKLAEAFSEAIFNKTYLSTVGNVIDAFRDPGRYLETTAKGLVGSLVPTAVRRGAQWADPIVRSTKGDGIIESLINPIKAGIPGLSQSLAPITTGTGEEVKRPSMVGGPLSPLGFMRAKDATPEGAALEQAFNKLDYVPGEPNHQLEILGKQVPLKQEDKRLLDLMDQRITTLARQFVASLRFQALPEYQQKKELESLYRRGRSKVRDYLKTKYIQAGALS